VLPRCREREQEERESAEQRDQRERECRAARERESARCSASRERERALRCAAERETGEIESNPKSWYIYTHSVISGRFGHSSLVVGSAIIN